MRIPSQFNEDSLYRNKRRGSLQSYRRIIRLTLATVLIVVVMNAASQEAIYQPFFGPPREGEVSGDADVGNSASASARSLALPEEQSQRDRQIADDFMAKLSILDQVSWTTAMIRLQQSDRSSQTSGQHLAIPLSELRQAIAEQESVMGDNNDAAWMNLLDNWIGTLQKVGESPDQCDAADSLRIRAMVAAGVSEAEKRVVDGAVWRSSDRDALRLRLEQASLPLNVNPYTSQSAVVGALPLLQQPLLFKGQPLRVNARVARGMKISEMNGDGKVKNPLPEHWQLWLRPDDGADRPILALVPSLPDTIHDVIADAPADTTLQDGPKVVVFGTLLKRLAYRSSAGADLAPVIVGRLWQPEPGNDVSVEPIAASESPVDRRLVLFGAVLLGILIASVIMWRTQAVAKQTRKLRHAKDLSSLKFDIPRPTENHESDNQS